MANKQKTFESTNLPALVNKIVKVRFKNVFFIHPQRTYSLFHILRFMFVFSAQGQFAPIRGNYSQDFKSLVGGEHRQRAGPSPAVPYHNVYTYIKMHISSGSGLFAN